MPKNEISQLPKLLSCAEKHGLRIAWNPSPMNEKITPDMLSSVNWLFVNEVEAEQLCGSNQARSAWIVCRPCVPKEL